MYEVGEISLEWFDKFISERNRAVVAGKDTFMFDGKEVLVAYADYVIEYLSKMIPEFAVDKSYISLN